MMESTTVLKSTVRYGTPAQASDPRNNNTDGDAFDDGEEDKNGNGVVDSNETDPTQERILGDFDNDGLENWQENLSCTLWNVADTDFGEELTVMNPRKPRNRSV